MNILVNGVGNIGTTLLNLLCDYKAALGITAIFAHKNQYTPWQANDIERLQARGVQFCSKAARTGFLPYQTVAPKIDYIFECTANGMGLENKAAYLNLPNLRGVCAQGSEKGFGLPFMTGVNESVILGEKWVQVVSCNTHSTSSLLQTFAGKQLENLDTADFVVVRRSEDLGQHKRLVTANVVARHLSPQIGTHHAIDVVDLWRTRGIEVPITASDITTPSQLLHGVRFHIRLKEPLTQDVQRYIEANPYVSYSDKFDSNAIFELGRRYGRYGRIYNHLIVIANNLLHSAHTLKGWAFVPQEGNTLLSTLQAFMWQTQHPQREALMTQLRSDLLQAKW